MELRIDFIETEIMFQLLEIIEVRLKTAEPRLREKARGVQRKQTYIGARVDNRIGCRCRPLVRPAHELARDQVVSLVTRAEFDHCRNPIDLNVQAHDPILREGIDPVEIQASRYPAVCAKNPEAREEEGEALVAPCARGAFHECIRKAFRARTSDSRFAEAIDEVR
jgi:hypothetical protein